MKAATTQRKRLGRTPGAKNRISHQVSTYLRHRGIATRGREPIELDYELANRPMATDLEELTAFAEHLGCSRLEAFREWRAVKRDLYPRIYPTLSSIALHAPGAPGSGILAPVDGDLPVIDITEFESLAK
jgi:hypothetical protein